MQDANAQATTHIIRAQKMKNPSHLSQPQRRKRLHQSRGDIKSQTKMNTL